MNDLSRSSYKVQTKSFWESSTAQAPQRSKSSLRCMLEHYRRRQVAAKAAAANLNTHPEHQDALWG